MNTSDHELMRRCRDGDMAAFEELVRRWEGPVARILARLGQPSSEAEDLAQEVFLRVLDARGRYRACGAFSTWLYRITLNVARSAVKADPYKQKPTRKHVPMYQKLIQALVGNAQYAEAQQLMEAIKDAQAEPSASEKPGPRFPARLVVSATKSQLDQMAAGKMTRQEFDKQAIVEYVNPHPVKAKQDEAATRSPLPTVDFSTNR